MQPVLSTEIDFAKPGRSLWQVRLGGGRLEGDDEYCLPMAVYNRGDRPAVLLTGGAHGDEFEGPACLRRMIGAGDFDSAIGRLIVIPVLNPPALAARQRRSPLDGLDMNRSYPGVRDGTPTEATAYFLANEILPRVEAVYDLHAGGNSELICPSIMTLAVDDGRLMRACVDAMIGSGLPVTLVTREFSDRGMLDAEALRQGKVFGCLELGSGGTLTVDSLSVARTAVLNLLRHHGAMRGARESIVWRGRREPYLLELSDESGMVAAVRDGFFVPACAPGDRVHRGTALGQVLSTRDLRKPELQVRARDEGIVYLISAGGTVAAGEQLAVVAQERPAVERLLARSRREGGAT